MRGQPNLEVFGWMTWGREASDSSNYVVCFFEYDDTVDSQWTTKIWASVLPELELRTKAVGGSKG